jgi:hypothetical protein
MLPAGEMYPEVHLDVLLPIYRELTGAKLETQDIMDQLDQPVHFPRSHPAMTRAQAIDMIDKALFEAGIVVRHPDTKHVVFRMKR